MKKTIVIYYSNKGSNEYLAKKIAADLACDVEEIKPNAKGFFFVLTGMHFGIKDLENKIEDYDRVILCGPIWMGKFISPLRGFVKKYINKINELIFVTCCGSTDEKKDDKFGYGAVFKEVENLLGGRCTNCQAFPIGLVLPEEQQEDSDAFMNTHLNDDNFNGEIKDRYDNFIQKVSAR